MKRLLTELNSCCCFIALLSLIQALPIQDTNGIDFPHANRTATDNVCVHENTIYREGQNFSTSNPCETCTCEPPGFSCSLSSCDLKPGCKAIHKANRCCPEYVCECERNGKIYGNGEKVEEPNPCKVCYCKGGEIKCALVTCYTRDDCEPGYVAGVCCPKYDHCPPLEMMKNKSTTPDPAPVIISDLKTESSSGIRHKDLKKFALHDRLRNELVTETPPTSEDPAETTPTDTTATTELLTTTTIEGSTLETTTEDVTDVSVGSTDSDWSTTTEFDFTTQWEDENSTDFSVTTTDATTWEGNLTTVPTTTAGFERIEELPTTTDGLTTTTDEGLTTTEGSTTPEDVTTTEGWSTEPTWSTTTDISTTLEADNTTETTWSTEEDTTIEYTTTNSRLEMRHGKLDEAEISNIADPTPSTTEGGEEDEIPNQNVVKVLVPKTMKKDLDLVQRNMDGPAPIVVMISADQIQFLKLAEEPPVYVENDHLEDHRSEQDHLGVVVIPKTTPTTVEMVKVVDGTSSAQTVSTTVETDFEAKPVNTSRSTKDIELER